MQQSSKQQRAIFPVQTKLNEAVAELGGYFAVLEQAQVQSSLAKALAMDDLPAAVIAVALSGDDGGLAAQSLAAISAGGGGGGKGGGDGAGDGGGEGGKDGEGSSANSSSAVDHTFHVARNAVLRALAAGHPQTCSAVVNHVSNALSTDLYDVLVGRAQKAAEALGKVGRVAWLLGCLLAYLLAFLSSSRHRMNATK